MQILLDVQDFQTILILDVRDFQTLSPILIVMIATVLLQLVALDGTMSALSLLANSTWQKPYSYML